MKPKTVLQIDNEGNINGEFIDDILRKIIELTAFEDEDSGDVWGMDTVIGTMDELINKAKDILMVNIKPKQK